MMSQQGGAERRTDRRYLTRFEIRFRHAEDAARAFLTSSINISAGGLCLKSDSPHAVGEELRLSMTIDRERFELHGVVTWIRNGALGVRFANITPQLRTRLDKVLEAVAEPE